MRDDSAIDRTMDSIEFLNNGPTLCEHHTRDNEFHSQESPLLSATP